jgi:hypothetical protein
VSDETKHSPEPWGAFRLDVSGTDEFKAYTARCIDQGAPEDFYIVMVEKPDGPADVCHVGNGPTSAENARRIVACVNALAGIPTEALEAGTLGMVLGEAHELIAEWNDHREHEEPDGQPNNRIAHVLADALRALGRLP